MKVDFYKHPLSLKNHLSFRKIIRGDIITSGPIGTLVERKICNFLNVKNTILTSSWTTGAIITLLSLNLKKNDEVILPSMTFAATANVVELLGAKPIFVDTNKDTIITSYNEVIKKITKKTKVIFPVHLYGNMFDTKKLHKYIKKKKLKIDIIEDSAHSFESTLKGDKSGKWSKAAIFSFYATKNITCGEGGAIITNDIKFAKKIKELKNFGLNLTALERYKSKRHNDVDMKNLGIKAHLSDLLSFLLLPQIKDIKKNLILRKKIYKRYINLLKDVKVKIPKIPSGCSSAFHIFVIGVEKRKRNKIIDYLKKKQIGCSLHYKPLHKMTYYKNKYNLIDKNFPNTTEWGDSCITLPFHLKLTAKEQIYVVQTLKDAIRKIK